MIPLPSQYIMDLQQLTYAQKLLPIESWSNEINFYIIMFYSHSIKLELFVDYPLFINFFLYFGGVIAYQLIFQQMQQENIKIGQEDSDNDEGFIVNTVEIKEKEAFKLNPQLHARPNDYQARYITVNHLMRKEIQELVNSYPHFARQDIPSNEYLPKKKVKEGVMHPQERYFNSKNYRLVYQRNSKRIEKDDSYSQNDIALASVVSYSSDNYSLIKNWEMREGNQQLVFESRFQSGNLALAYKSLTEINTYILFMQNDTNSKGYNKWFYFAIKNAKKNTTYTISIVNFRKYFAFFKHGMKITKFSQQDHRHTGNGWSKCGKNIQFYRSQLSTLTNPDQNLYYTLSFDITFDHENDITFISLLPPYSYTKLINFLQEAKSTSKDRDNFKFQMSTISYSLGNTQVPYVTISSNEQSKKNIVILARQHPGEVWSSYLTESIIRELMRDSNAEKDWLLKHYTFRIFPMVNVDGVIYGNFRCDLSGMDLNRCWKYPNKLIHPHLIAIKEEIARLAAQEEISCCLDMHSHSKDYNIFAYCCKTDNEGRVLPYLFSRMSPLFHFPSCTFGISKYKETTARATIYDISKTHDVLTIESSFFAFNNPFKTVHPSIFLNFANALLKSFKFYYSKSKQYMEAAEALPKAMAEVDQLRNKNNKLFDEQSGSDSEPECDEIAMTQKIGKILPKCQAVEVAFGITQDQKEKSQVKPKQQSLKKILKKIQPKRVKEPKLFQRSTIQMQSTRRDDGKTPIIPGRSLTIGINPFPLQRLLKKSERNNKKEVKNQVIPPEPQLVLHLGSDRKNQSLQLPAARSTMQKNFLTTNFRQTVRDKGASRYELHYRYEKREEEEFPLLCVLSERKKQVHLQKLRRIHPTPSQRQRAIVCYQPTLVVNKKLDTMERLRERQKNSSDLVASIWKKNVTADSEFPSRSIFYGGL